MKEYTRAEFEEFARIAFYKGREVASYNTDGELVFKRPTFNGFLREIEALPESQCGCPKGICVGHVDTQIIEPTFRGDVNDIDKTERGVILDTLIEIISEQLGIPEHEINADDHLKNDLGLDSADIIDFGFEIEKEFEIRLENEMFDHMGDTIQDVITLVEKLKTKN